MPTNEPMDDAYAEELLNLQRRKALFEAAASADTFERVKKENEILLQRARNINRPSIMLSATLSRTENGWVAEARGVSAEGDSPEQACLNFDFLWTQGDQNER